MVLLPADGDAAATRALVDQVGSPLMLLSSLLARVQFCSLVLVQLWAGWLSCKSANLPRACLCLWLASLPVSKGCLCRKKGGPGGSARSLVAIELDAVSAQQRAPRVSVPTPVSLMLSLARSLLDLVKWLACTLALVCLPWHQAQAAAFLFPRHCSSPCSLSSVPPPLLCLCLPLPLPLFSPK